ncbi:MAG: lamin tail domain-containing protein [Saprospiraceae bacterium]|nr:lamin tail domain-containing protein [Saprospiraceae bacterium]
MKFRFLLLPLLFSNMLQAQNGAGVVINEFLASSDSLSGIPDPSGSFADWIELYNNTNNLVNLSGFYLSDDYVFFDKFIFPTGAQIEADGYVIIWADQDLTEAGLHADFKLNKSGEEIILLNASQEVLDSISYGPQETNVSLARIPNGTGDFTQRAPTFSANNDPQTSAVNQVIASSIHVSPNPGSGPFTVDWPTQLAASPDAWDLLDLQGRSIQIQVVPFGESQFMIQVAPKVAGMYLLWIRVDNQFYVKRLVIQAD